LFSEKKPVKLLLRSGWKVQGIKQEMTNMIAAAMPIQWEYFIIEKEAANIVESIWTILIKWPG